MTTMNINLDAKDSKNHCIEINGKNVTEAINSLYIRCTKGQAPSAHLVLTDLSKLSINGQTMENVSELLSLSKKDRQSLETEKVKRIDKQILLITALIGLIGLVAVCIIAGLK